MVWVIGGGGENTGLIGEVFALKPMTESSVFASISRRLRISTKRLKWCRNSEPRIGYGKFATVKTYVKSLRNSKSREREIWSYVGIGEWFIACGVMGDTGGFTVRSFSGQILQAAPVSTKQRAWDLELLRKSCGECAVLSSPDLSFPG